MPHSADKVAVCCCYAAFVLRQNTHIAAQAGAAGRSGNGSAGINKGVDIAAVHSLLINLLGCRDDNHTHMVAYLVAFENFGSLFKIFQTAIGAGADDNLVDFDCMTFLSRMSVFRQMRISNNRNKLVELNIEYAEVYLASPYTAAASAITGYITSPEEVVK